MLLITSGRGAVTANPDLAKFVQDPTARGLPARYRVFIALTPGPAAKSTGVSGIGDTDTGAHAIVAEVVYPPFSYVLAFDGAEVYKNRCYGTLQTCPAQGKRRSGTLNRAVIYCRVSTKEQTHNLSLSTQLRTCREYCERHGIEVAEEFEDAGESAKNDRSAGFPRNARVLPLAQTESAVRCCLQRNQILSKHTRPCRSSDLVARPWHTASIRQRANQR